MRDVARRLRALERRFAPEVASEQTLRLLARIEAGRRRCGLPPPSPERVAETRNMGIVVILHRGRERVALARAEFMKSTAGDMPIRVGQDRGKP